MEHTIKIKKFTWWWLLLFLPLLLLIPLKKNVYVQTIDAESGNPVSNVNVYFHYAKQSVRVSGSPVFKFERLTDANGVVEFYALRYRVYSWIFKHFSETLIYANTGCYSSDTLKPYFHHIWGNDTIKLNISPIFIPFDFKVVDADDNEPLPDAKVKIISEYNGKQYIDSAISQPDGRVYFPRVPKCGKVHIVKGTTDGYYPDSIVNKEIDELFGSIDSTRLLKLKPIKEKIVFFVIDCKTKEPIPGATVTIDFDYKGKKKTQKKRTNVNGVGKGEYSDAHIIADITLEAEKPYYKNGRLPGKHKVKDFINLPPDQRTICLEPIENCIQFKNIDERTGKPLSGVKNIVKIKKGSRERIDTIMSNGNGIFIVCEVVLGDEISIVATYPPNYEDNTTKIKDANGLDLVKAPIGDRTIPLKPKEIELVFRSVEDSTWTLIPRVKLKIIVDGVLISLPNNSGNGEFKVKTPLSSVISIVADGRDINYTLNDTTIKNEPVSKLILATQKERDIPLRKPEYTVDVIFTIDLSGSMGDKLESIKTNISNFYTLLQTEMISHSKNPEIIRIKLIGFHDAKCEATKFYYVPDELSNFKSSISILSVSGGTENGLDALSMAFNSKWQTVGIKRRRIIFLFTDDVSQPFGTCPLNTTITNHNQMKDLWDKLQPNTHLIMFLNPSSETGYIELKAWTNVTSFDIRSYNFNRIIEEIVKRL